MKVGLDLSNQNESMILNVSVCVEFGVTRTVDLKPNGSNIPITRDNKLEYILRVSHYRLTKQIKEQSSAFFEGLSAMIDPKWLRYDHVPPESRLFFQLMDDCRMFNQQELQLLLGGVNTPIDLEDLRRNTNYGGLYDDKEPTIVAFWRVRPQTERPTSLFVGFLLHAHFVSSQVVEGFDAEQRRALLRFVTSVGRPPLLCVLSEQLSHVVRDVDIHASVLFI
jgi:ubiquitin-protein ligase E3 C